MFCLICTRPVQNSKDENKLCQSCALRIKIKGDCKEEGAFNDIDNLEHLQKKLLNDLNLEGDSDYEAELEYLTQVKRSTLLSKQRNLRSPKSIEGVSEHLLCGKLSESDEMKKFHAENVLHAVKSEISENEFKPEFFIATKRIHTGSHSNVQLKESKNTFQKLPEHCDQQVSKVKPNRRVTLNNSKVFTIKPVNDTTRNLNQVQSSIACSCRAVIRPTTKQGEPLPQFENIHSLQCQSGSVEQVPSHAYKNPFLCPVSACKNIVPVSDFIKHFKLNHIRVPIVAVDPGTCTNLFWDAKVDQFGFTNCLMLLLTTRKVKQFGYGQYKDCLPIAIMTTKVRYLELLTDFQCENETGHFHMIWLTSMCSNDAQVCCTVTAWSGMDDRQNGVHVVNSDQLYSLREDQDPNMIYRSGRAMILTKEQIKKLTHGYEKSVKLQVVIH